MNSREYREHISSFYKYQSWIYRLFALWKLKETTSPRFRQLHKIYFNFILFFWVLSFDASCTIQFIVNITDLNEVIKVIFIFSTSMSVLAKFTSIKMKNRTYAELVETMYQPNLRPMNSQEIKLFRKSKKLTKFVRNSYCIISLAALHTTLLTPLIVGTAELPFSLYNPIEINTERRYILMYVYQYIAVSICCYMNIAFDSISASFLIYIKGQLDILCDRLEHLGLNGEVIDDRTITLELKNCLEYYAKILRITRVIENLISLPLSIQVACSVLVLVANFYVMSRLSDPGDFAKLILIFVYQLCMLSQIYILCYFPSEVTAKSQKIAYYLYSSSWIEWSKLNRRLMLLMMNRFDIPIRIRSVNPTYTFNLAAFTSIVNSSYSYFALLKRVNS